MAYQSPASLINAAKSSAELPITTLLSSSSSSCSFVPTAVKKLGDGFLISAQRFRCFSTADEVPFVFLKIKQSDSLNILILSIKNYVNQTRFHLPSSFLFFLFYFFMLVFKVVVSFDLRLCHILVLSREQSNYYKLALVYLYLAKYRLSGDLKIDYNG